MENFLSIYNILSEYYGRQNWWPIIMNGESIYAEEFLKRERSVEEIFEIAIGAILTQNTTWTNVIKAIANLKKNRLFTVSALNNVEQERLAETIRCAGYYNQKAKKIKAFIGFIDSELNSDLMNLKSLDKLQARKLLLGIWGVGRETADSIALYGYDHPLFIIDAYTKRLFGRLGLLDKEESYDKSQRRFTDNLPEEPLIYKEYHALIVEMGKNVCRTKPNCENCILYNQCSREL